MAASLVMRSATCHARASLARRMRTPGAAPAQTVASVSTPFSRTTPSLLRQASRATRSSPTSFESARRQTQLANRPAAAPGRLTIPTPARTARRLRARARAIASIPSTATIAPFPRAERARGSSATTMQQETPARARSVARRERRHTKQQHSRAPEATKDETHVSNGNLHAGVGGG